MTGPINPRLRIKKDLLAGTAVALAPLIYFFPVLRAGRVLCPDDGVLQNVPLRVVISQIIRGGRLPLWNPYIFSGMPLLATAQGGVLFPLNWFYLIFSPLLATNLDVLATYSLAGVGAYLYARRARANLPGALATSVIWQFCGFMVAHIGHINALQTIALMPWLLWAIDGYGQIGKRRQGALIVIIVSLQVFAGHQQTLAYALLLAIAYAATMSLNFSKPARARYVSTLAMMIAGLALAAVQILPTAELARNSVRATASYEFFTSFSLPPQFLLTLFAPYVLGGGDARLFKAFYIGPEFYGEYIGYVGLLTISLAFVCVLLVREIRVRFWAIIAIVALILALGSFLPFGAFHLLYRIPIINLFRVPARHLMEFDFAVAVLAGRGLTELSTAANRKRLVRWSVGIAAAVFLLTALTVTVWRPADFRLWNDEPVALMRAPELFVPLLLAALSMISLGSFARSPGPRATVFLLALLILDLGVWGQFGGWGGQFSGWRVTSPSSSSAYWREPVSMKFLNGAPDELLRILTAPQPLDPNDRQGEIGKGSEFAPSLLPDFYMMHRVQNAAGYDGFGLARYSELADDMQVWGDLAEPEKSLSGDSRAIDLLGVRYLLVRNPKRDAVSSLKRLPDTPMMNIGGDLFAVDSLSLPELKAGDKFTFNTPRFQTDHLALATNLTWSTEVADGTIVGRVHLNAEDGRVFEFLIRAGQDTADWAHDRPDLRAQVRHREPPIASSYPVEDPQAGSFEGHAYLSEFGLPERVALVGGEIELAAVPAAPQLTLSIQKVSLIDKSDGYTLPLRAEWTRKELHDQETAADENASPANGDLHWRKLGETNVLVAYENSRALPRAWLATQTKVLKDEDLLKVIRTGNLPDGSKWDPRATALIEAPIDDHVAEVAQPSDSQLRADVVTYEPDRVQINTASNKASVLILSDNHYPGWRTYVDGRAAETLRVDYNLRGVPLTAGEHRVEFVYRPKSVFIGLIISLLTLGAMVVWWKWWPHHTLPLTRDDF